MIYRTAASLLLSTTLLVTGQAAYGNIPTADLQKIAMELLNAQEARRKREEEVKTTAAREKQADVAKSQLAAADETLKLLTETSSLLPDLEGAGASYSAASIYAIDDDNPYAERLFGDARVTTEQMIVETVKKYAGHPGLSSAGLNTVEFRCLFQALIKQESNFSMTAKSHVGAYGLTQIMPGTAKDLGVYPAYYSDPRVQLDGGARYLLAQLKKFGSVPLALAAYNAGPGNVMKYGGVPPFTETQNYVKRITGFYNRYAARVSGADEIGTLDPKDMVIAEASNISDAGMGYANASMNTMHGAMSRLRDIIVQIEKTGSVKEALDLNTAARAEVARMTNIIIRLQAASRKVEAARYALLFQAYAEDAEYLEVRMD